MSGKANIFKKRQIDSQDTDDFNEGKTKFNIFKSGSIDEEAGEPEIAVTLPPQNVFKAKSDDTRSLGAETSNSATRLLNSEIKQSKSNPFTKLAFISAGTLVGFGVGAYSFLSSDSPTNIPPAASSKAEAQSQVIPPQVPISLPTSASAPSTFSAESFKPYLSAMLQAAHDRNNSALDQAIHSLSGAPHPQVGNRALARYYNDQGLAELRAKNFSAAIGSFSLGVAADPGNPELINNLGFALYKNGQNSAAKEQIEHVLILSPTRSSAWINLADIFFKENNEASAIDAYTLAYSFATNKERVYKTVESLAENDPDSYSRIFYTKVLAELRRSKL